MNTGEKCFLCSFQRKVLTWCRVSAVCLLPSTMQPFSVQKVSGREKKRDSPLHEVSRSCVFTSTSFIVRERIYDSLSRVSDAVVTSNDVNYRTQSFGVSYTDI
jgi:hypothetical protein